MSQGEFTSPRYRANDDKVYGGQAQPETTELTITVAGGTDLVNNGSTQPLTPGLPSYKISKGKREIGVGPRTATFKFAADDQVPDGYKLGETYTVPIFVNTFWDAVGRGVVGTYQGNAIEYLTKAPENIR